MEQPNNKLNSCLVIGATGSIGKSVVKVFREKNYNVIGTSSNPNEEYFTLDLTNRRSIDNFTNQIENVKHLVIAAGKEPQQSLDELDEDHFDSMISIHYSGPLWLIKNLKPKFDFGSQITLISSIASYKGSYDPVYASVKGAINSLVRTLARELAPKTRVNGISPGLIKNSTVFKRMTEDFRNNHLETILTKEFLNVDDVAKTILFLDTQKSINGQIIHINGGQYFGG